MLQGREGMKVPVPAELCLQDFNGDVARGWLADKVANRRAGQASEMAHRQSGGYKEEPGVAVAGDHVSSIFFSVRAFSYCRFFFCERWDRAFILAFVLFLATRPSLHCFTSRFSHFASYSASVQVYQG